MSEAPVPYTVTPVAAAYVPPTEAKMAFLAALAAAQGEYLPILRNRNVKIVGKDKEGNRVEYTFKYAELSEIIEKTRPGLSKNGLSLRSRVLPHDAAGMIWLQSILAHAEGHEDVAEMAIQVAGDIKLFGGQLSYLRRYMASGQLGIASEDDDESATEAGTQNIGGAGDRQQAQQRNKPQPRAPKPAAAPPPPAQAPAPQERDPADTDQGAAQADEPGAADTTGPRVTGAQAKWIAGKLDAYFKPEEVKKFLTERGFASAEDVPAASWDTLRAELVALD